MGKQYPRIFQNALFQIFGRGFDMLTNETQNQGQWKSE